MLCSKQYALQELRQVAMETVTTRFPPTSLELCIPKPIPKPLFLYSARKIIWLDEKRYKY
jgi:hypothetical protein